MTWIAVGVGGASLIAGGVESAVAKGKANAIQKNLHDPVYNIPPEFAQNREIARQMAQQGLPQQVLNHQTNAINQNQAGAIAALSNSANPGGNLAGIVRQGDQAMGRLNSEDATARNNNQRYFIQQNKDYGNQELAKQQSDVFDKYTRNFNQMQAYNGAAQQDMNNAINGGIQLAGTALATRNYGFGNPSTTTNSPALDQQNFSFGAPAQFQGAGFGTFANGVPPNVPPYTNWQQF